MCIGMRVDAINSHPVVSLWHLYKNQHDQVLRCAKLQMILETQAGNHDKSPLFDMERVSAFVIEPVDTTTYLTVDGEKVELEKLSMEVHRKLVKFVCA